MGLLSLLNGSKNLQNRRGHSGTYSCTAILSLTFLETSEVFKTDEVIPALLFSSLPEF